MYRLATENDYVPPVSIPTSPPGFKFKDNRKSEMSSLPQSDDDSHNHGDGDGGQSGPNNSGGSGHHHLPANSHHHHHPSRTESIVTISGGPLSYRYNFDSIYLHFGRTDVFGSEHVVAGVSFPAEVRTFSLQRFYIIIIQQQLFFIFSSPLILNLIYCLDPFVPSFFFVLYSPFSLKRAFYDFL